MPKLCYSWLSATPDNTACPQWLRVVFFHPMGEMDLLNIHNHGSEYHETHTHVYTYACICVCVCVSFGYLMPSGKRWLIQWKYYPVARSCKISSAEHLFLNFASITLHPQQFCSAIFPAVVKFLNEMCSWVARSGTEKK